MSPEEEKQSYQRAVTPEMVYAEWHMAYNLAKGQPVRRCQNFENARQRDDWSYFVSAASFYNRNITRLDWKLLIKSVASYYGGWFPPKEIQGQSAVRIYQLYTRKLKTCPTVELEESEVVDRIKRSIIFVCSYMKLRNIATVSDYFAENLDSYPTAVLHYEESKIDFMFLACFPFIKELLMSYPADVVADAFPDFEEKYLEARKNIMFRNKLAKIAENMPEIINRYVEIKSKEISSEENNLT